jgi:cytoplasmic iron level regulating protein YaaA (DUF328/UPF0246 family)
VSEDWEDGRSEFICSFAKGAWGLMARHSIGRCVTDLAGLQRFRAEGYRFAAMACVDDRLVFRRRIDLAQ